MNTKNILWISLACFALACSGKKENGFKLSGTIEKGAGKTLVLEQSGPNGFVALDSAKIGENGEFVFENTKLPRLDFYRLKLSDEKYAILVMDSTQKIVFKADADKMEESYTVEGSEDTRQFIALNTILRKINVSLDSLRNDLTNQMQSLKKDSLTMDSLNRVAEANYNNIIDRSSPALVAEVEKYPGTIANFAAFANIFIEKHLQLYEKIEASLKKRCPDNYYCQQLSKSIEQYKKQMESMSSMAGGIEIGKPMPEIQLPSLKGGILKLSSLRGKVVLVDFWASWCGPCRKENPNVVAMYQRFKAKGFDVFSISLDEDGEKWKKAVQDDKLTWNHVSDLKGWESAVCAQFGITSIPFTILLDKQGNVVAKGLRGNELGSKLAELLP